MDFSTGEIMEELGKIKEKADEFKTIGSKQFMCPILEEVMKYPHVAADGFSYELEAIEEWLSMGHNTSPMDKPETRLPNHTLRSLIQDWHSKQAAKASS